MAKHAHKSKYNPKLLLALKLIAVPVVGFILLNLTFMLAALFQTVLDFVLRLFGVMPDINMRVYWLPILKHGLFVAAMLVASWYILRSKIGDTYKAIYSIVPMAIIYVVIGMAFYWLPVVQYILGVLFAGAIFYYLYRTKKPWIYYYAWAFVSIVMLFVAVSGMDI